MEFKPNVNEEISLKDFVIKLRGWWMYLISKWLILLLSVVIGGLIGIVYAIGKKPIYTAELSFVLEDNQPGGALGAYSGIASMMGIDGGSSGGGIFIGDNLIEFMRSRSMIEKTLLTPINKENSYKTLAELYIDISGYRKTWSKNAKLREIHFFANEDRSRFTREKDSLLLKFYNNIITNNLSVAKKDKKLSIVTVSVKTENELFSKYFTETLVNVVANFYIVTKTLKSAENLTILTHQVDSVRRSLTSAITGVASSADVNPNQNLARQVLRVPSQNRQVDVQVNTTALQELVKNLELAKITFRREKPLIQVIDKPMLPLKKDQMSTARAAIYGALIFGLIASSYLLIRRFLKAIL